MTPLMAGYDEGDALEQAQALSERIALYLAAGLLMVVYLFLLRGQLEIPREHLLAAIRVCMFFSLLSEGLFLARIGLWLLNRQVDQRSEGP